MLPPMSTTTTTALLSANAITLAGAVRATHAAAIVVTPTGLRFGPPAQAGEHELNLLHELDLPSVWGAPFKSDVDVDVVSDPGPEVAPLRLAGRAVLANKWAAWTTNESGLSAGSRVLLVPRSWSTHALGRDFLKAWDRCGWQFAFVDDAFRSVLSSSRLVSADGVFARVDEPAGGLVVPNGGAAALALALSPVVLKRMLHLAGASANAWIADEQTRSGWFTRMQIAGRIHAALLDDKDQLELGGALPVFAVSEGASSTSTLSSLVFRARLPRVDPEWWNSAAKPAYLKSPSGGIRMQGIPWDELPTNVVAGVDASRVVFFFRFRGKRCDIVGLDQRDVVTGAAFSALVPDYVEPPAEAPPLPVPAPVRVELPKSPSSTSNPAAVIPPPPPPRRSAPQPVITPPVPPPSPPPSPLPVERGAGGERSTVVVPNVVPRVSPLTPQPPLPRTGEGEEKEKEKEKEKETTTTPMPGSTFLPGHFAIDRPHRRESIAVTVDGQRLDGVTIKKLPDAIVSTDSFYVIDGQRIAHGSIVRVDFDPLPQDAKTGRT
ncbi:MAG: hypothetical protein Q8O67_10735 [Deltaproteobacteria bacterium]|nr:hypothetical protein [Deltaproteobacteria bacterium]